MGIFCVNPEKEKKKNLRQWFGPGFLTGWCALELQFSVLLREKTGKGILEHVCYTVLLEILNKIHGPIHFLFALNRKAPNVSV